MADIKEASEILAALGMPPRQCNRMAALTLIALCGLRPGLTWSRAERRRCTVTKGIMDFLSEHYDAQYAPNTRETFRRQVLHQFTQGRIAAYNPFDPSLPTNSPHAHYAITEEALATVRLYGTDGWSGGVERFLENRGALIEQYSRDRAFDLVPIRLADGRELQLSPGKHNEVQKAIVEQFAPRFAPDSLLVYLGDTAKKDLYVDEDLLSNLCIPITGHDKLPDIVIYDPKGDRLFLMEAVTSHGPMTPKRIVELDEMLEKCSAHKVYVSVFPDVIEFRKHLNEIAWETEVWLCDTPNHMIHFNGDRFLGPSA